MLRSRLVELEDQNWFADWMRQYQIDFLGKFSLVSNLYKPATKLFTDTYAKNVLDLASGNGHSAKSLFRYLNFQWVRFTDKFPDPNFPEIEKLDILNDKLPPAELYTMFNGLHHFSEEEITHIIRKAGTQGKLIFIEPLSPNILTCLKVFLATLILPFFLVPFMKPFRWDRLIMTYLIPIGPFICFYDGIVSVLKSYSLKELNKICKNSELSRLSVKAGQLDGKLTKLIYLAN